MIMIYTHLKEYVALYVVIVYEIDEVVGVLEMRDEVARGRVGRVERGPVGLPQHERLVLERGRREAQRERGREEGGRERERGRDKRRKGGGREGASKSGERQRAVECMNHVISTDKSCDHTPPRMHVPSIYGS